MDIHTYVCKSVTKSHLVEATAPGGTLFLHLYMLTTEVCLLIFSQIVNVLVNVQDQIFRDSIF